MIVSFLVFVFALFLVLGAYLLATHGSDKKRAKLQKRLSEALMHSAHTEDIDVVLARNELMSEIPWVNRTLINIQATFHLKRMLDQADLHITPSRVLMFSFMAGILGGLAASVLTVFIPLMLLAGVVCAALPLAHVWWRRKKRFDAFLEQLPDALDLVSRALSAGHAFSEALHMVSEEMPEPVATEFRKAYEEQNLGLSVKLALENLTQRMPLLDLKMCVTAVLIQRETGGNLAEILEKVAYTIRYQFPIVSLAAVRVADLRRTGSYSAES
jgi:tight adherence protein B